MLHGSEYIAPPSMRLFEGKHQEVTNAENMEDHASRERVLCWIAKQIAIDGEHERWITNMPITITKGTLTFPAKVLWDFIRAQLLPTANDNTFSHPLLHL